MDITPDAEGVRPIAIYTYDAGGERILKHSNTSVSIYLNGKKVADTIQVDATLYPSGMLVAKLGNNGSEEEQTLAYTKHYFAGTQRVSSKIGTTENLGDFLQDWFTQGTGGPVDVIGSSFGVLENAEQGVVQVYDEFDIEPPVYDSNPVFIPVQSFVHGDNEIEQYFFHPDHLGSTSYITNLLGEVSQHIEYFAFGETFVEEHRSSNNSPYKFNGKELDEETGWYYYGARYYDPRISIWLSVDPLAEKYPSISPYVYCANNPVVFTDPDGRDVIWSAFLRKALGSEFIKKVSNLSSFKSIFGRFIKNHDNHFFEVKVLSHGNMGHGASAQVNRGKHGFITNIQEEYFVNDKLIVDETFLVMVILHEGIHQRKNLRISQDGISNYEGYNDHYNNDYHKNNQASSDLHHNQMAMFNRDELISGMKEFDKVNETSHSDDWYEAMSWFGLKRTEAWKDFKAKNPTKANLYENLQKQEIQKMEKASESAKRKSP